MRPSTLPVLAFALVFVFAGCVGAPEDASDAEPATAAGVLPEGPLALPEHMPAEGITHQDVGVEAPDFTVTTIDGETFTLSEHRGKVVLIEFMAAGCGGCKANLPEQKELWASHGDDPRFVFVALDAWETEDDADLEAYREEHGIPWPLAMSDNALEAEYGFRGTPTHIFVDHNGHFHAHGRFLYSDALHDEVAFLLQQVPA